MRPLSSQLLAAQKKLNAKPAVQLVIRDQQVLVNRLHWQALYSGQEPEGYVGGCQAADGSIVRARLEGTSLQVQRVTNPTSTSQWSTWQILVASGGASADCNPLLVANPQSPAVWLFYVDNTGYTIKCFTSNDYGASWGTAQTVRTESAGDAIAGLGGAIRAAGGDSDPMLFYCYNPAGAGSDAVVKYMEYENGWGTPSTWPVAGKYALKGAACAHQGDFNLLIAGREASPPYNFRLWAIVLGDGYSLAPGSWGDLEEVLVSDDLDLAYQYPSLVYADTFRALYQESFADAGGYNRLAHFRNVSGADFIDNQFTDITPFNLTTTYNGVLAYTTGSYLYLLTAKRAYRSNIGTALSVDVSNYLVSYRSRQGEGGGGQTFPLVIELDNSAGTFAHIGEAGDPYEALKRGSQIELRRGYYVGGASYTDLHPYAWIEDYEYRGLPHQNRLVLYCVGGWELLARWRADRQYYWADDEDSVFTIASRILGFLGFDLSLTGQASSEMASFKPSFTIQPGESARAALLRLLEKVPDVLFFYADITYAKALASGEAASYAYGGAGEHPILEGRYRTSSLRHSQVQTFGKASAFAEALDWAEVELMGRRLTKAFDYAYETSAECAFRAQSLVRAEQVQAKGGTLVVRPNVGQELYDCIAITDPQAGLAGAKRRVLEIQEEYEAAKSVFQQELTLGDA